MHSNTRDRLKEVQFYFEHMQGSLENQENFRYYLHAFLNAARSVTLVMRQEFGKISGFEEWYRERQIQMDNDKEMKDLKNKRNIVLKKSPIKPNKTGTIQLGLTYQVESKEALDMPESGRITIIQYFFDDYPEKDVVTLCKEHLKKLEIIVDGCESKFYR